MSSNNRPLTAWVLAALMIVPAIVVLLPPNAEAADTVPFAVGGDVKWVPLVGHPTVVYFDAKLCSEASCLNPNNPTGSASNVQVRRTTTHPPPPCSNPSGTTCGQDLTFAVTTNGQSTTGTLAPRAVFVTDPLLHAVNVTGNTSVQVRWERGNVPRAWSEGLKWYVTVKALNPGGAQTLGQKVFTDSDALYGTREKEYLETYVPIDHRFGTTFEFQKNGRLQVEIEARTTAAAVPIGEAGQWTMRVYDPQKPSYVKVFSNDGIKAAAWTNNRNGEMQTLFRPNATVERINKIDAVFAIKSAFGETDVRCSTCNPERPFEPVLSVLHEDKPYAFGNDSVGATPLTLDAANTSYEPGLYAYRLARAWDYTYAPAGEYKIRVAASLRGEDLRQAPHGVNVEWKFVISAQALTIRPYDDPDPTATRHPLEDLAHHVASGGSTSYLLLLRNGGRANDTVTIVPTAISTQPAQGWTANVKGPRMVGFNQVQLAPNQEALVVVTITAPSNAKVGDRAVFTVTAVSGLDGTTKSQPISLVTSVSDTITSRAGLVGFNDTKQTIKSTLTHTYSYYAWNRGTRTANLTVNLRDAPTAGWNLTLLDDLNRPVNSITFSGVGPGDIRPFKVAVRAEAGRPGGDVHTATINATLASGAGQGADRQISFELRTFNDFRVEVLHGIADKIHYVEMACRSPSPLVCGNNQGAPDGTDRLDTIHGAWFRVWVTNTGSTDDRYRPSLQSSGVDLGETPFGGGFDINPSLNPNFPPSPKPNDFYFTLRQVDGRERPVPGGGLFLKPGETGEFYVWISQTGDSGQNASAKYVFRIGVTSENARRTSYQTVEVHATDDEHKEVAGVHHNQILLDSVRRLPEYAFTSGEIRPLVDTSLVRQGREGSIKSFVDVGGNVSYFVRVTNGASWREYNNSAGQHFTPNITIEVTNPKREFGWTVEMRPVNGTIDPKKNPWKPGLTLSNWNPHKKRAEAFVDHEIEIRVTPPSPSGAHRQHAFAGASLSFNLFATNNFGGRANLSFDTIITNLPNVTVKANTLKQLVHPDATTSFILHMANNGSSATVANLKARVVDPTTNPEAWALSPAEQNFELLPHENRTVALVLRAPASVAPGDKAVVNVTVTYRKNPSDPTSIVNRSMDLEAEVRQLSNLRLESTSTATAGTPGRIVNFTLVVRNENSVNSMPYKVRVTPLNNWTQFLTTSSGILSPKGQSESSKEIAYTAIVPTDVISGRSYFSTISVVKDDASDPNAADEFDAVTLRIDVVNGVPIPVLEHTRADRLIQRGGSTTYDLAITNFGNTAGSFPLEATVTTSGWTTRITDADGKTIQSIEVKPRERKSFRLVVTAPSAVTEGARVQITVSAYSPLEQTVRSDLLLRALVHNYGVDAEVRPVRLDLVPGSSSEFSVRVTNVGNGNDTVRLSLDQRGLKGWSVDFGTPTLELLPGQTHEARLIIRSPKDTLPSPRAYTMTLQATSGGAAAAGLARSDSVDVVVNVLNYHAFDVDDDGQLEIAVDNNKRTSDGFERFIEVYFDGPQTQMVDNFSGNRDGKIDFILETPTSGSYTGVGNVYYDPDRNYVYKIQHTPDITGDSTPDYLLDTDDDGRIDSAWDTAGRVLMRVTIIRLFANGGEQYLVDTNNDGKPDKYYDPTKNIVTRVLPGTRSTQYGIDTQGDGRAHKYFDTASGTVTEATVGNFSTFVRDYWYFFALFVGMVLVSVMLFTRRRPPQSRAQAPDQPASDGSGVTIDGAGPRR